MKFPGESLVEAGLGIGEKLIDRLFPDPEQKAKAQMELLRLKQEGEFEELRQRMDAIVAEAQSDDPWTSRARPSFLYVMYTMILAAIPMGILYAFQPETATAIATGLKAWLDAIPGEMWTLFGAGYLGYTWKRSQDKKTIIEGKTK